MMLFATDENFNGRMLRGLLSRLPDLDVIRIQDTIMYEANDPDLLSWLAEEQRILLTHDIKTIPTFAYERIQRGLFMPGIIGVQASYPVGQCIDELEIIISTGQKSDFENVIVYVPLG